MTTPATLRFQPGEKIRIRADEHPGHHRVPLYLKGTHGVIVHFLAEERNPETLAYGQDGLPRVPVYQVRFPQRELWPDYHGGGRDALVSNILETWLEHLEP